MMQDTTDCGCAPICVQTAGFDPTGRVLVRLRRGHKPVAARVSARLNAQDVRTFVDAGCDALVLMTQAHVAVIVDFAANETCLEQAASKPRILSCDAIDLAGAARLYVDGQTLHVRAHHMVLRAQGEQRLMGATVHVG